MRNLWRKLTYRIWLIFGGNRTEEGFRFLSADIIENRRRYNELHSKILELDRRLWELEDHTVEEHGERAKAAWEAFSGMAREFDRTPEELDKLVEMVRRS